MVVKINLIVAVCENMGIGINGKLPWKLKTEMAYFTKMTTETQDPTKKNIALMGRNTWDCIPSKFRPLKNRINMVLTRNLDFKSDEDVIIKHSLEEAMEALNSPEYKDKVESVWCIGGSHLYKDIMESKYFYRLYLTDVKAHFECDTFMPKFGENLKLVEDSRVSSEENEENGIKFIFKVYENSNFGS